MNDEVLQTMPISFLLTRVLEVVYLVFNQIVGRLSTFYVRRSYLTNTEEKRAFSNLIIGFLNSFGEHFKLNS